MGKLVNSLKRKKESLRSLGVDLQLCFSPFPTAASVKEDARIFSSYRVPVYEKTHFFPSIPSKSHTHADESMISKFSTGTKYTFAHSL